MCGRDGLGSQLRWLRTALGLLILSLYWKHACTLTGVTFPVFLLCVDFADEEEPHGECWSRASSPPCKKTGCPPQKGPQKLRKGWGAPQRKRASEACGRLGCASQKGSQRSLGKAGVPLIGRGPWRSLPKNEPQCHPSSSFQSIFKWKTT